MKKTVIFTLFFAFFFASVSAVIARENPFVPLQEPTERTNSSAIAPAQLESEVIALPESARVLKSLTLTHQAVDGSIATTNRKIEKTIDWHSAIRVDQPNAVKLPRKTGIFAPIEALEEFRRVRFFTAGDVMKLETKDELIRSFFLPRPSRIVIDLNSTEPFDAQNAALGGEYFSAISVTYHDKFYRIVITLDSYYPYSLEAAQGGFELGLN